MSGKRLSSRTGKKIGLWRRQFLGDAMAVVAAGSLLETAAALAK